MFVIGFRTYSQYLPTSKSKRHFHGYIGSAYFSSVHACLPAGSVVGSHGNTGQCVYSASKAGLEGLTRSLAKEVGSRGIRANLIAPGKVV